MPVQCTVQHQHKKSRANKTGALTEVKVQRTIGAHAPSGKGAPEGRLDPTLWESEVVTRVIGGREYQAQKFLPSQITGGTGTKAEGNVDLVGQRGVYLVGHEMHPDRALCGPIYTCGNTYLRWFIPLEDHHMWGLWRQMVPWTPDMQQESKMVNLYTWSVQHAQGTMERRIYRWEGGFGKRRQVRWEGMVDTLVVEPDATISPLEGVPEQSGGRVRHLVAPQNSGQRAVCLGRGGGNTAAQVWF